KAWKTRLSGNYNDQEFSYLYSPCYDVSGLANPTLSLSLALDLEDCGSTLCDKGYMEYSTDGINWNRLGTSLQGTNWYNKNYTADTCWSIQNYTRWHVATTSLPKNVSRLRLRFVLKSDPATNYEGIAIDDIHIYDNTDSIYNGATMTAPVTQNILGGSSWVDFTSGGKLIASIQPNGQNMGKTYVQAYINTGSVRTSRGQYYHDRNLTIKPATNSLRDSVTVRFYFLDSETESLINATGCGTCTKPSMAYELGVSKYADPDTSFENGAITDDLPGSWLYIIPDLVTKVPFDKGYYAEFKVKNFSEFWLNNGSTDHATPLSILLVTFTATKKPNNDVLVQWTTAEEQNVNRYEIEVARGNSEYQQNHFVKIGEVSSRGNQTQQQQYEFTDAESNKSGVRYYRLKIIDNDGTFSYSNVRPVVFNDEIKWQVYPNPSAGIFNLIFQSGNDQAMAVKVYDMNGRLIQQANTMANGFVQKLVIDLHESKYASGLYLIRAEAGGKKQSFTFMKQ
ncbi:MAG TPA: T9SS type A sorting domain-containing protein, partial [Chitinophagaceae bacterium]|nr:T9SS type A sorting domain-containing protein [Chitinophagaceae bacterium]